MELSRRSSGILLHPTSLPSPFGIGELGPEAYRFVDFLVEAEQSIWQILPLGPVGFGASPYSTFGALAGNPMLISLRQLAAEGDLLDSELAGMPRTPEDRVDYALVDRWKMPRLEQAAQRFLDRADSARRDAYERFCREHQSWLGPFTFFMALKSTLATRQRKLDTGAPPGTPIGTPILPSVNRKLCSIARSTATAAHRAPGAAVLLL